MRQRVSGQEVLPGYKPLQGGSKARKSTALRNIMLLLAVCLMGYLFVRSSEITGALGISAPSRHPKPGAAASGFSSHAADSLAAAQQQQQHGSLGGKDVDDGAMEIDTDTPHSSSSGSSDNSARTLRPAAAVDRAHALDGQGAPKFVPGGDLVDAADEQHGGKEQQHADSGSSSHHALEPHGVYALTATDIDGHEVPLSRYAGKVTIFANVASKCGYTDSNYKGLQALYEKYHAAGLEILAFPSNNFGAQEPGSNADIKAFCSGTYHTTFPLFAKVDVNGPATHRVWAHLKQALKVENLAWNFQKILVNRAGQPVKLITQEWDTARMEAEVHALLTEVTSA